MIYDNEQTARGACVGKRWQQTMTWLHEAR